MTTTDHAIVAPAVTGDPGTRADAGGASLQQRVQLLNVDDRQMNELAKMASRHIFAKRLRDARFFRGLTQLEAGKLLGVSDVHLAYIESEGAAPASDLLERAIEKYDLDLNYFFEVDDEVAAKVFGTVPIDTRRIVMSIRHEKARGYVVDGVQKALLDLVERIDAPPAPAQSAGAVADGEDDAAEYPNVTQEHLEEIVATWHPVTDLHRVASELLHLRRRGARPHEPADASARSARGEVAEVSSSFGGMGGAAAAFGVTDRVRIIPYNLLRKITTCVRYMSCCRRARRSFASAYDFRRQGA